MTKIDWTIDTNILYKASDNIPQAINFLNKVITKNERVAFDSQRHIMREYQQCVYDAMVNKKKTHEFLRSWLKEVTDRLATRKSGKIDTSHENALKRIGFRKDDFAFVGVCSRTDSKNLVTEDNKGYKSKVKSYLKNQMSINVLNIKQALNV